MCMVPDINTHVDNLFVVGRTPSITSRGMTTVALLNHKEGQLELPRGAKLAKVHLVKTRHIRIPNEDIITQQNQGEHDRLKLLCLSTKDETFEQHKLKFDIDNIFSLNSSSLSEIPFTKSSISSSVLSSYSNFPSADDKAQVSQMLPDISELRERLTPEQLERLQYVLMRNQGVFAKSKSDLGSTNLVEHRIDPEPNAVPWREGARRLAPFKAEKAKEELQRLLSLDLVEPAYSSWV